MIEAMDTFLELAKQSVCMGPLLVFNKQIVTVLLSR